MAQFHNKRLTPGEGRRFGLTVGAAFLVLAGAAWWREWPSLSTAAAVAGASLVTAAVLLPGRLGPIHAGWMRLALVASWVTTPILLAIMYFGLITPIGLLVRARGKNPIVRRHSGGSYWIERPEGSRTSDLKRQF